MTTTLYCQECSGRGMVTWDHPNDPCARLQPCDVCEATGVARCGAYGCAQIAVDAVVVARSFTPLCARHFAEHQADAAA